MTQTLFFAITALLAILCMKLAFSGPYAKPAVIRSTRRLDPAERTCRRDGDR